MQFKILSKSRLLAIGFSGLAFVVMLFLYFSPYSLNTISYDQSDNGSSFSIPNAEAYYGLEKNDYSLPIRLKIPKIKVDAIIEHVGFAKDGSVGVPKGPKTAA